MPLHTVSISSPLPPERIREVAVATLSQAGLETQTAIRQELEAAGRVDTGLLRNAVTAQAPVVEFGRVRQETVVQGPAAAYAAAVDQGRRPGGPMPPLAPIRRWLERKRLVSQQGRRASAKERRAIVRRSLAEENVSAELTGLIRSGGVSQSYQRRLDRAAFALARAIARRGIKAVHAFAKGAARVLPRLRGIFDRHFARIVR